ncbi:hypothetical protein SBV1_1570060 [Verrucomicrobia bacterium]|nr:hypothetical protein SBV1_1570060 [Verrucomicrobiota bacterium]
MTQSQQPETQAAETYWLARFAILRLLGAVYAVAFLAAATQVLPLIGSHGLLPLDNYLSRIPPPGLEAPAQ